MNIEIVRLVNVSWLQVPDRQALAMRMVALPVKRARIQADRPSTQVLERLPALDWPITLFVDHDAGR